MQRIIQAAQNEAAECGVYLLSNCGIPRIWFKTWSSELELSIAKLSARKKVSQVSCGSGKVTAKRTRWNGLGMRSMLGAEYARYRGFVYVEEHWQAVTYEA